MKSKIKLLYGDVAVIAVLSILCLVLFIIPFFSKGSLKAEIYFDGELKQSIVLSSLKESQSLKLNECELLIENDGITFLNSSCPDRLCVACGKLKRSGDTMACIPRKVTVTLKSEKGFTPDSVTY